MPKEYYEEKFDAALKCKICGALLIQYEGGYRHKWEEE